VSAGVIALALLALPACGDGAGAPIAEPPPAVRERLLDIADQAAKSNGGQATRVEAAETTRAAANELIGAGVTGPEAVWVQVDAGSGEEFRGIRGGAKGRYLYLVLRQADYVYTDGGMGPIRNDLSRLGDVALLRG
jgi:hypothetical protein